MALPIIGDVINAVKDVISEVVVDKDKRNQINLQLKEIEDKAEARYHDEVLAQIDVNKTEAGSGSLFVAGWRPFAGWVGGFGLAYAAVLEPLLSWIARVNGYLGTFPAINNELLLYVLGGMLGLGVQRTFEKVKGVSTDDLHDVPGRKSTPETTSVNVSAQGEVNVEQKGGTTTVAAPPAVVVKKKKHFHIF